MSSGKRSFQGKEAMHRMNFLYQAANLCREISSRDSRKLSMYYSSQITSVGRKAQCRMAPEMKRTLCKGCCGLLILGDTATVRLIKKPDPSIAWVCLTCGTFKNFRTRTNYSIWCEKPESVVETFDCSEPEASHAENNGTFVNDCKVSITDKNSAMTADVPKD